jgi:hypothetical protein
MTKSLSRKMFKSKSQKWQSLVDAFNFNKSISIGVLEYWGAGEMT